MSEVRVIWALCCGFSTDSVFTFAFFPRKPTSIVRSTDGNEKIKVSQRELPGGGRCHFFANNDVIKRALYQFAFGLVVR